MCSKEWFPVQNGSTNAATPPIIYVDSTGLATSLAYRLSIDSGMAVCGNEYCVATVVDL